MTAHIHWKIVNSPNPENVQFYNVKINSNGTYTLELINKPKKIIIPHDHHHEACMGNCKRHPLMSPEIRRMYNGSMRWGDMLC